MNDQRAQVSALNILIQAYLNSLQQLKPMRAQSTQVQEIIALTEKKLGIVQKKLEQIAGVEDAIAELAEASDEPIIVKH